MKKITGKLTTEPITSEKDKELFRWKIKNDLRKAISNVDDNLDDCAFEMINGKEGEGWNCEINLKIIPYFNEHNISTKGFIPLIIDGLNKYGITLNKHTTDEELDKVANRIINEYNDLVDKEIEYRKLSM